MPLEISPRDLAMHLENGRAIRLLDVRQPWEANLAQLANSQFIPLSELPARASEIPSDADAMLVVYCHHGVRSLSAVHYLRQLGHADTCSLAGGIDAWSCEVDPTLPRY
ncbi:MAG TPA: rhodanese-like domain-containing protein [Gemmataceae bacterium]|nr:rhodanese-like domain-containing protein [Gemmataceae bacterium]